MQPCTIIDGHTQIQAATISLSLSCTHTHTNKHMRICAIQRHINIFSRVNIIIKTSSLSLSLALPLPPVNTAIKSITYDSHDVRLLFLINSPESETASVIFIRRWQLFSIKKPILGMCKRFESDAVIADQWKYSRLRINSLHWGLISHCAYWIELQGLITSETWQVHTLIIILSSFIKFFLHYFHLNTDSLEATVFFSSPAATARHSTHC